MLGACRVLRAFSVALALVVGFLGTAQAANTDVTVAKQLCSPDCNGGGPTNIVSRYAQVTYQIELANTTLAPLTVDLQENFAPGFMFVSATCLPSSSQALTFTAAPSPYTGGPMTFGPISLPAGTVPGAVGPSVFCYIVGAFMQVPGGTANAGNTVSVVTHSQPLSTVPGTPLGTSNTVNAALNPLLRSDISITKTLRSPPAAPGLNLSNGPQTAIYDITITNNGSYDLYLGPDFQLQDEVGISPSSVPLSVSLVGNAQVSCTAPNACLDPVPAVNAGTVYVGANAWKSLATWRFPANSTGLLKAHGTTSLSYKISIDTLSHATQVNFNCSAAGGGPSLLKNSVTMNFRLGNTTVPVRDASLANNSSSAANNAGANPDVPIAPQQPPPVVNPACGGKADGNPFLGLTKTLVTPQPAGGFAWGSPITYRIDITNTTPGPLPIFSIGLVDSVTEMAGTPSFIASVAATPPISCTPACQTTTPTTSTLTFYGDTEQVLSTAQTAFTLASGASASYLVTLQYTNNAPCDAYPASVAQWIQNTALAHVDIRAQASDPPRVIDVADLSKVRMAPK